MKKITLLLMGLCFLTLSLPAQNKNAGKEKEPERMASEPSTIALENLIAHKSDSYVITKETFSRKSGIRHVYLRQAINGLEIYGTESSVHFDKAGKVLISHNKFLHDAPTTLKNSSQGISAEQAISSVAAQMGYRISNLRELKHIGGVNKAAVFNNAGISSEEIPVKLMYYYRPGIGTQLVWELSIAEMTSSDWWNFRVDAATGAIIDKDNWTVSCNILGDHNDHVHSEAVAPFVGPMPKPVMPQATEKEAGMAPPTASYRVYAMPVENPNYGTRTLVTNPENLVASPYGWHDTNGNDTPEYTNTRGNNVDAYDDDNANNNPDGKYAASPGGNLVFDFPLNTTYSSGNQSENAAITNLFYWSNIIHDVTYMYGFDEISGNFQFNNYGNGGLGNDPVNAEAQDGSGTCNANFATPSDGSRPRMQMYVCNTRDGDLDNAVIVHEYGHGISNRLTGGPAASSCLQNQEQMGEGWSDYYSLMLTMEPGDAGPDSRGVGTWLIGEGPGGPGIRVYPYSTNFAINPHTYDDIKAAVAPHGVGEIWATMLWEMTWEIMASVPFDADIYNGNGGNNISLALVTEGLKLQPCSPGFVDGRNAILAADQALYGGAYQCAIWEAFARRGLGYSANQGSSSSKSDGTEAFDLPPGFTSLDVVDEVCLAGGVVTGLSGGLPTGGVYSGTGVTDDGNGTTFTFDPSVGGPGNITVTYVVNDFCTGTPTTLTDAILVTNKAPEIICMGSGTIPMTGSQSANPGVAIPDGNTGGVKRTFTVSENVTITDLDVNVNISHTWVGDVIVEIKSPAGTVATIIDRPGRTTSGYGCSGNDIVATLDDEASLPVENECQSSVPTINGSFTPNNPLAVFDGQSTAGVWEITVKDVVSGDSGTLNSWGIVYDYEIIAPVLDVTLDSNGNATVNAQDLLYSIAVDCGTYSVLAGNPLSATVDFSCSDIGLNTVQVQASNNTGAIATCSAQVNVIGNGGGGTLTCPGNISQNTDPGICGAVVNYTVNSPAGCGGGNLTQTAGIASGGTFPVGTTTNTFQFDDGVNPIQTCSFDVTITDAENPVASCQNITVALDGSGNATITASAVDGGSSDNCAIVSKTVSQTNFNCSNIGANNVTLTVTDAAGNSSNCTAVVTVEDSLAPSAVCQNITVALDASGNASITASDVDGGSTDNCAIASMTVSQTNFNCSNIGANNVTLTVTDAAGNSSNCTAVVTVEDSLAPSAVCQNITVALDGSGNATITASDVDGGSSDNCAIASMTVSQTNFDCSDIGTNNVTLTVTDTSGNSASCTAVVTVEDSVAPVAVCQNISVQLDASGNASISAVDVDNGSTDNCGIVTRTIDVSSFNCSNLGTNNVTLTITDNSGNVSSCTAIVTVEDIIAPDISCPADQTVLVIFGELYTLPDYFGTGEATATDNCTDPVSNTTQNPAPGTQLGVGVHTITFTAQDDSGNSSTCSFDLTVEEELSVNTASLQTIRFFPNPAKSLVILENAQNLDLHQLNVYDLRGRRVLYANLKSMGSRKTIDVSQLASATYLVVVEGKNGRIVKRLIKE
jgi:subtilisin-like proprotein convertase family protein